MDNPYQSPQSMNQWSPAPDGTTGRVSTKVWQVQLVAILLMVEGGLELLMGLMYAAMATFMPFAMQQAVAQQGGANPPPPGLPWFLLGIYGGLGVIVLIAAGIKFYAGWQNYRYRGRALGFIALGSTLASLLGCYCSLTAIPLVIYGLIVYLNEDVGQAFAMAQQGYSPEQIKAAFQEQQPPIPPTM